ncbi:MAG: hypothetical protein ACM3PP_04450 [Candidatus Saccharibacteria bacterium]
MNLIEAEQYAIIEFRKLLVNRPIPEDIIPRLIKSMGKEGEFWSFSLCLLPDDEESIGLEKDFPNSVPMLAIRVHSETGYAELMEQPEIVW